jgi:1,2-diacylglycerol 3-beta-glucosyltransferase
MLSSLILVCTALYAAEMLLLTIGLRRANRKPPAVAGEPTVSVIVAARNEEAHIARCVDSLLRLDYPADKLEIVVVNDASRDRTGEILAGYLPRPGLRVLETSAEPGPLRGKTNAVATGIRNSSGEFILLTDADCTVGRGWVRETVHSFSPETGIVGGFTGLETERLFDRIQALDWFFLFSLASGAAGWSKPLTVIGNNFAIRRAAYEKTGGYEAIPFSVTEDYALVHAVLDRTEYAVRFPMHPEALVESHPCASLRHLFQQKRRWGVGGLDMVFRGMMIMAIGWITRLFVLVGIAGSAPFAAVVAALAIVVSDVLFLSAPLRVYRRLRLFRSLLVFECYLTSYALLLPFIAMLSRKVIWKERRL